MVLFSLTIFLSAFLLFNVQPLMGRYLLPWFGGSPAVWSTCLLFFQALLLGGYAYAHWLAARRRSTQKRVHLALLFATLLSLPATPSFESHSALVALSPQLQVIGILVLSVGLPFFTLSTNAPLIQHWFGQAFPTRSPYRLYALSNAGSLLALLVYPLLMEPFLPLRSQAILWSGGYLLFVAGCGICLMRLVPEPAAPLEQADQAVIEPVPRAQKLLWILLPALASVLLLATTNQLCQEVASVPFLWVLPLALYLLSFILTFEAERWYCRWFWGLLLALLAPVGLWAFYQGPVLGFVAQLLLYPGLLLVGCMVCHGELFSLRPSARQLTQFYLAIAAGGALGGVFVTFVAPGVFVTYREYELALLGICLITLASWVRQRVWSVDFHQPLFWVSIPLIAYLFALPFISIKLVRTAEPSVLDRSRNFFGTLVILQEQDRFGSHRTLLNGHIVHGVQYRDGDLRLRPMRYYAIGSPPEEVFSHYAEWSGATPNPRPLNIGVIGLGIGVMSVFGREGDTVRFYEINPLVIDASSRHFDFLARSPAHVQVVSGDARIVMEEELRSKGSNGFDILAVDAFTSDAIPMHLLTLESAQLYLSHLRPDGVLLFHVSNRYLDLNPVIRGLANECGCRAVQLTAREDAQTGRSPSQWVAVTRNQLLVQQLEQLPSAKPWRKEDRQPVLFTDDFSSLLKVLK